MYVFCSIPGQVSGVRFVTSTMKNTLSVEWSRPQSDTSILYYEFRYRRRGHAWQGPIRATTETATLHGSWIHSLGVQVKAVSAIGAGPYNREEILTGLLLV